MNILVLYIVLNQLCSIPILCRIEKKTNTLAILNPCQLLTSLLPGNPGFWGGWFGRRRDLSLSSGAFITIWRLFPAVRIRAERWVHFKVGDDRTNLRKEVDNINPCDVTTHFFLSRGRTSFFLSLSLPFLSACLSRSRFFKLIFSAARRKLCVSYLTVCFLVIILF